MFQKVNENNAAWVEAFKILRKNELVYVLPSRRIWVRDLRDCQSRLEMWQNVYPWNQVVKDLEEAGFVERKE